MKTITINVSEPVYDDFRRASKAQDRPASELIREAMEAYRREHLQGGGDLRGFRPRSAGRMLQEFTSHDDLLDEMLDDKS